MRQPVHTMFITNNRALYHLWWKKYLLKNQKVSKYYENDSGFTKLGLMVAQFDWLLPVKSQDPLITCSYKITWQAVIIIFWFHSAFSISLDLTVTTFSKAFYLNYLWFGNTQGQKNNLNHHIFNTKLLKVIKPGMMVAQLDWLLPVKSYDPLII